MARSSMFYFFVNIETMHDRANDLTMERVKDAEDGDRRVKGYDGSRF